MKRVVLYPTIHVFLSELRRRFREQNLVLLVSTGVTAKYSRITSIV